MPRPITLIPSVLAVLLMASCRSQHTPVRSQHTPVAKPVMNGCTWAYRYSKSIDSDSNEIFAQYLDYQFGCFPQVLFGNGQTDSAYSIIANRHGKIVFKSSNIDSSWLCRSEISCPVDLGYYAYFILRFSNGEADTLKGEFIVVTLNK